MTRKRFEEHLADLAGKAYDKHGSLTKVLPSLPLASKTDPTLDVQLDMKNKVNHVEAQILEIYSMLKSMQGAMLGRAEGTDDADDVMSTAGVVGGYAAVCQSAEFRDTLG